MARYDKGLRLAPVSVPTRLTDSAHDPSPRDPSRWIVLSRAVRAYGRAIGEGDGDPRAKRRADHGCVGGIGAALSATEGHTVRQGGTGCVINPARSAQSPAARTPTTARRRCSLPQQART